MALDAHGKIAWGRSDIGGDPIVVVLTETVSDAHLAGLRGEGVSYFFAGKSKLDLALILDILNRELGVKRLLLEAIVGDATLFIRRDEVETAWKIVDSIRKGWEGKALTNREFYAAGTWGPIAADDLLAQSGHDWHEPQVIK